MASTRAALVVALAAAAAACSKSNSSDRTGETTVTKATTTSTPTSATSDRGGGMQADARYELATARIAGVRCDRQITCEQIGPDKRFTSRDNCARDEARRTKEELRSSDCPGGIDTAKLQACLAELSRQDCNSIIGSLQTVDACKTAALCM